jgi:Sulfotransferase family
MICHQYKCVFIHIPKNAGQSIEQVFLDLTGLSWKTRAELLLRRNDRPELGPPRLAHLLAHEYVLYEYLTQEQFDTYFKFSLVRNPWSRAVSIYKYLGSSDHDFRTFVMKRLPKKLWKSKYWFVRPQSDFVYHDGRLLTDFIGRFETIQQDFNEVCMRLGLPPINVPHINKSETKKQRFRLRPRQLITFLFQRRHAATPKNYQEYYDDETRERVAELYESDVTLFQYSFEGLADRTSGK